MVCPNCDQIFTEAKSRDIAPDNDDDDDDNSQPRGRGRKKKKPTISANSKGLDALDFEPAVESTWLEKSDNDPEFSLTPSTKTAALKSTLLKGFDEAPLDKVWYLDEPWHVTRLSWNLIARTY